MQTLRNNTAELVNYNFQVVEGGKSVQDLPRRSKKLAIAVKTGFIFIKPEEISKIESYGNQAIISLINGDEHVASKSLKEFEELLTTDQFLRVHKCFIINLDCVKRFDREMNYIEMEDGTRADVSRRKKDEFFKSFFYV